MTFPWMPVLGAAAAMAVVAMLLRRFGGGATDAGAPDPTTLDGRAPSAPPAPEAPQAEDDMADLFDLDEEDEPAGDAMLAVTSDGQVFMPAGHDVRVLPLGEAHALVASGQVRWEQVRDEIIATARRSGDGSAMPGVQLDVGDFTAGRVTRGAPDVDPWRLELLGLDGEYQPFAFETDEAARSALAMLETKGIIKRPRGDDDQPVPVPDEQFDEARRAFEDTLEELSNMPDVNDIEEPGH